MPATISLLRCAIFSLLSCTSFSLLCRAKNRLFCQTWVGFFANRRATHTIYKHLILKVFQMFSELNRCSVPEMGDDYLVDLASH